MSEIFLKKSWIFAEKKKKIYLYNSATSKTFELNGEKDFILFLLIKIKKKIDIKSLFREVKKEFPFIAQKYFQKSIKALGKIYALEKEQEDFKYGLSNQYLLRLDRQIEFFKEIFPKKNPYKMQSKIKNTKIAVLGLGSLGQQIIISLVSAGVGNFKIVDFDKVESRNIGRQPIFEEEDIGKYKTDVVGKYLKYLKTGIKIIPINTMLKDEKQVKNIIQDCDLVVHCCDYPRFEIHRIINRACLELKKPNLVAATRHIGPFSIPYKTACYECFEMFIEKTFPFYKIFADRIKNEGFIRFPELGITPSISGTLASKEIIAHILNYVPETYNGIIMVNPITLRITYHSFSREINCNSCKNK